MATIKAQNNQRNAANTAWDVIHHETEASVVLMDDGATKLSDRLKIQTAAGTATAITLTGVELVNGFQLTFVVLSSNSGAATTINSKPLYKPGTTVAPKLIAGKAATVWYSSVGGCFFIKASAEGTAAAGDVLAGKTFSNDDNVGIAGALSLIGTAGVGDVVSGKTFYNTDAKTVQIGTGAGAKRFASGTFYATSYAFETLSIRNLNFKPSFVFVSNQMDASNLSFSYGVLNSLASGITSGSTYRINDGSVGSPGFVSLANGFDINYKERNTLSVLWMWIAFE